MLYLTIPCGEYVKVGDSILIYNTNKEQIKVGIDAPTNVVILRQRVIERQQQEEMSRLAEIDVDG